MSKLVPLFSSHQALGAKFVDFAGYSMPVQYSSIIDEHKTVREHVGIFDVSHMGEIEILGKDSCSFLNEILVNDASTLKAGEAQYTIMLYEHGGAIDDLIIYCIKPNEKYLAIVNASNIEKDFSWMVSHQGKWDVSLYNKSDELSLLAIQGPLSEKTLAPLCATNLNSLKYFTFIETTISGVPAIIARTGYTGEDGFEICLDNTHAKHVWDTILDRGKAYNIKPIGLGARDTLRLEMGYALYGHELSESINPIQAGLGWVVKMNKRSFIGKEALAKEKASPSLSLIGFTIKGEKVVAREGADVVLKTDLNKDDTPKSIGKVRSGSISPMLGIPIGTALIAHEHKCSNLMAMIRGKAFPLLVTKPPFWKNKKK